MKMLRFLFRNYPLFIILIFAVFLLSFNINKPFIGHHDFNSAFFSDIGRDLTRYNIQNTKLGLVQGGGPQNPNHLYFYTHNVPLHPWLIALSFYLFGQGEFQARIISVIASLGMLFFIYKISQKLFSVPTAILAGLFFVTSSMFIYFGSNVFPEPLTILFSLASFYFFILWLEKRRTRDFYLLLILSFLSMLSVWGSYFLPPLLVLYYLIFEKKKDYKKIFIFGLLPVIVFGFFLFHLFIIEGANFIPQLSFAFTSRLNVPLPNSPDSISLKTFFTEEFHRMIAYYSKTTIVLTLGWLLMLIYKIAKRNLSKEFFLLSVLLLWGLAYPLIFQKAAFIHDYFLIYLAPFIAISSAAFLTNLVKHVKITGRPVKFLVVIILFSFPLLQFFQTKNFTSALLATNSNQPGYILGKLLAKDTNFNDKILVLSGQYGAFFGVFANYYADRIIYYQDFTLTNFKKLNISSGFDYIVYVEGRDTAPDVKSYLAENYPFTKSDIYTIFKTKK